MQKTVFPLLNTQKNVFCDELSHLCNLKSELTLAQIWFSIVKHSKRSVLQWISAFVQFKVRVGTWTKLIFHSKTHKKTYFEEEFRIYLFSSLSWNLHKSYFPPQNTKKDVFVIEYCITELKVRVDSCTNRISHCKTLKNTCFWWIIAFVQFNVRVGTCTKLIFHSKTKTRRVLQWNFAFAQFQSSVDTCTNQIFNCKTLKMTCFVVEYCICAI